MELEHEPRARGDPLSDALAPDVGGRSRRVAGDPAATTLIVRALQIDDDVVRDLGRRRDDLGRGEPAVLRPVRLHVYVAIVEHALGRNVFRLRDGDDLVRLVTELPTWLERVGKRGRSHITLGRSGLDPRQ